MFTIPYQYPDTYQTVEYWLVLFVTILLVIGAAWFHYEMFRLLSRIVARLRGTHRVRIFYLMLSLIGVHMLEIGLFALGYYLLHTLGAGEVLVVSYSPSGGITEVFAGSLFDHIYFSAVVYTTLGFGELVPLGPLRLLTGMEALIGLVLITWSASFMFIEMQKFWHDADPK